MEWRHHRLQSYHRLLPLTGYGPVTSDNQITDYSLLVPPVARPAVSYDDLENRLGDLERDDTRNVVALPDGSVDHWYAVGGPGGERLASREAFGRRVLAGEGDTFPLEPLETRPGGQAVNAARQGHALGDDVTLVAALEHSVFADLAVETHSTGEPARIEVLSFDGEEVLLPERAPEGDGWDLETLAAAFDLERLRTADGLCCTNWVTYRGVAEVFEHLAANPVEREGVPLVCDPGAVGGVSASARRDLFDALTAAASSHEVICSVNRAELEAAVDALDGESGDGEASGDGEGEAKGDRESGDGDASRDDGSSGDRSDLEALAAVRRATGIDAVVLHAADVAAAATSDGTERLEMLDVEEPRIATGAGDRFAAGLLCARARGWPWRTALALGNACAAHFVETGETADPAELRSFLEDR